MWSLGCILGEMLRGKPLFPGTSTINQIERIMETIVKPSEVCQSNSPQTSLTLTQLKKFKILG